MKRKTAKISELVSRLEFLKEELGDIPVYVMHATEDALEVGAKVELNGLSKNAQIMQTTRTGNPGVLIFQSDESIRLI